MKNENMKTTPPPLPFAELLKRATPGPFKVRSLLNGEEHECFIEARVKGKPYGQEILGDDYFPELNRRADVELVARLLSWAHAGGVEELREAGQALSTIAEFPEYEPLADDLRASLALLDGQREGI